MVTEESAKLGAVIRDSSGKIVVYASYHNAQAHDALTPEIIAIQFGLKLACGLGFKHLIVECDSLPSLSLMIDKGESLMWERGTLVFDILDLAKECDTCLFQHVNRD